MTDTSGNTQRANPSYRAGFNSGSKGRMTTDETEGDQKYMKGWNEGMSAWYSKWFPFLANSK